MLVRVYALKFISNKFYHFGKLSIFIGRPAGGWVTDIRTLPDRGREGLLIPKFGRASFMDGLKYVLFFLRKVKENAMTGITN